MVGDRCDAGGLVEVGDVAQAAEIVSQAPEGVAWYGWRSDLLVGEELVDLFGPEIAMG